MRILLTVLVLLLAGLPAFAQMHRSGGGGRAGADPAAAARKKQADDELDRAYKAATDSVPTTAAKPDPWGNIRNADTGKTKKK